MRAMTAKILAAGQHTSADGSQRLGESQHGDIHLVGQTEMSRCSATTRAKYTEAVRIVHHHTSVIFLC